MNSFGERLSAARKAKGYTQDKLAELVNVSRQTVSHWENGRAMPDVSTARQLSQLLDCDFFADDETAAPQCDAPAAPQCDAPAAQPDEPSIVRPDEQPALRPNTPDAPQPKRRSRKPLYGALALIALCALAAVFLAPRIMRMSKAAIAVTPPSPVSYLEINPDEFGSQNDTGWIVTFKFENTSSVPFTPDTVVVLFYQNDRIDDKISLDDSDIYQWMAEDKLYAGKTPLYLQFGSNHLNLTRIECVIYGTDDNGHALQFSGDVTLSQQYADEVSEPSNE